MKTILSRFLISLLFLLPMTSSLHAAQEMYTLDPGHSYVLWHINHFGFSNPSGKWMAEGTLALDEANPKNSKVDVTIKVSDMITGIPKLDEHLKGGDFFDIAKFPTARFLSDKIDITGKDTAILHGILTVHGVSKPILLAVRLNKVGESIMTHKKTTGFTASTSLKRSDFGINKYLPGLGDEVKIDIEIEAFKNADNGIT